MFDGSDPVSGWPMRSRQLRARADGSRFLPRLRSSNFVQWMARSGFKAGNREVIEPSVGSNRRL
jgi:hypothetical protein